MAWDTEGTKRKIKDAATAEFLDQAHRRGIRVITDLVMNHTSDTHAWFTESRADPEGPYGDFYVWSDTDEKYPDARIIFVDTEVSNWTFDPIRRQFFWHRFFSHQPDLNFENPAVHEAMFDIVRFWMDLGIDGFRLDAVPYLYEEDGHNGENHPKTHEFLSRLRAMVDEEYPGRILLAEANQMPHEVVDYFGTPEAPDYECALLSLPHLFGTRLETIPARTPYLQPPSDAVARWAARLGGLGGFAGMFDASALQGMRRPVLATSTDGVGTKVAIAQALDTHDTIGFDLVGMVVDDIVVCGAEPLFMTDYIATGKVVPERIAAIVGGIAAGLLYAVRRRSTAIQLGLLGGLAALLFAAAYVSFAMADLSWIQIVR